MYTPSLKSHAVTRRSHDKWTSRERGDKRECLLMQRSFSLTARNAVRAIMKRYNATRMEHGHFSEQPKARDSTWSLSGHDPCT